MKKIILTLFAAFSLTLFGQLSLQPAYAACPTEDSANSAKEQAQVGIGATGDNCNGGGVTDFVGAVIRVLSIVVGIAAVIMIIVSGFKYITSNGDSGKISSAKNTLIYALVGLVIAALAQFLVHFVLTQSAASTCSSGTHLSKTGESCVKD